MDKYINTKQIEPYLHREEHGTPDERWRPESEFARIIDSIPSADVVEVKHGEWIELPNGWDGIDEYLRFECSECHREVFSNFPYCPYCGADMRRKLND